MAGNTKIQWADKTWGPTRGCSRVSEGCRHCYAETLAARYSAYGAKSDSPFAGFVTKINGHAAWTGKVEIAESTLDAPLHWKNPARIFVNSMSDLFHENLSIMDIKSVFDVMQKAYWHTFQVLTKRASRMAEICQFLKENYDDVYPLPNVWLGVSAEDQQRADERIPLLLSTPAAIRFVSYEPALGPVDFSAWLDGHEDHGVDYSRPVGQKVGACIGYTPPLDWVICGGESGPGARPFDLDWARDIRDQCKDASVKFFFKQAGSRPMVKMGDGQSFWLNFKGKGGDLEQIPEDLRIREFPE